MRNEKIEVCGMLVSPEAHAEIMSTWPKPVGIGLCSDPRVWSAACANHVLLVARSFGEEPETAPKKE